MQRWKTVLFSDESKFNVLSSDGIAFVRREPRTRYKPNHVRATLKHGGGSTMVWGCFSGQGCGPLHQVSGIMDRFGYKNILETVMLPYAEEEMPLVWTFQHDNDQKHTSKCVKEFLEVKKVEMLDWPAQSPDLNPIENLWGILKRRVRGQRFSSTKALFEALKTEWESIPMKTINSLITLMPKRCEAVIKNNGYWTKY